MAHSYTPGLAVADQTVVKRRRLLPLPGTVLVEVGHRVRSDQAVARAELPGKVYPINLANQLSIVPDEIKDYLVKKEGDSVEKDEIIAENKPLIKWFKTEIRSPVAGTIEARSEVTGQVLLREPPRVVNLLAHIDGTIVETIPSQGVVVETTCSLVQGIFGIGGEAWGELLVAVSSPWRSGNEAGAVTDRRSRSRRSQQAPPASAAPTSAATRPKLAPASTWPARGRYRPPPPCPTRVTWPSSATNPPSPRGSVVRCAAAMTAPDSIAAVVNGGVVELDDDVASRWGPRIADYIEQVGAAVVAVGTRQAAG